MNTINLSVDLNELNTDQVQALSIFVNTFSGGAHNNKCSIHTPERVAHLIPEPTDEEKAAGQEKKKRAPRGSKAQAGAFEGQERTESAVDGYEAAKEAPVTDATDAEDNDIMGDDSPKLTFDDIRGIASEKMLHKVKGTENKDKLKAELTRLKLSKLIDMQDRPELYTDFYDFAKSL